VLEPVESTDCCDEETIDVTAPKNVIFSVASVRPAFDEIVIVPTPDVPSANTRTGSPALTVMARPIAVYESLIATAGPLHLPIPSEPAPVMVAV